MKTNMIEDTRDNAPVMESDATIVIANDTVPILPIRGTVAYPQMRVPFLVSLKEASMIEEAMQTDRIVGLLTVKDADVAEPVPGELYEVGTIAKVVHARKNDDGVLAVMLKGLNRFRVATWLPGGPYLRAKIHRAPEVIESGIEMEALQRQLHQLVKEVMELAPHIPADVAEAILRIDDPLQLTYVTAFNLELATETRQNLLEIDSLDQKIRELLALLSHEKEVLTMGRRIQAEVRQKMDQSKREYMLRQKLEALKKELGDDENSDGEGDEYARRIAAAEMPADALKEAQRELERFQQMSPQSAEYPMIKTYLDWMIDLPWNRTSEDIGDVSAARRILDEDHYGLEDVKERLVEFIAVRRLIKDRETTPQRPNASTGQGVILCLAGPPGVGKTSLGRSVARALGREFTRMSLGGVRDEAEIRGHRRTYIGAMPGRIIQAVKRAGTRNPVFMLDEIDKVGQDWRGDPSSALLEVLDPAQNNTFRDHYLDVDFDLSEVIFIATANRLDTIPGPLRDRMEVIELDGYTGLEKLQIAKRHLIPRQLRAHGLQDDEVTFMDDAVTKIIDHYTREAGVRNLERNLAAVCRKGIVELSEKGWPHVVVTPKTVSAYLKKERYRDEKSENICVPGIAAGLAVTSVGGDILYIEASRMAGQGRLTITGQLGEVMKESAEIAYSFVRAQAPSLAIDPADFKKFDVHLHVPAGALPKDGPSAGVAMVLALASLFTRRPVRSDVGITGEITLRGRVLPVGGLKMKTLAAHRAGLTTVFLPAGNSPDLDDLPPEVRETMTLIPVDRVADVLSQAMVAPQTPGLGDVTLGADGPQEREGSVAGSVPSVCH